MVTADFKELTDKQMDDLAYRVVALLNGIPISQAMSVLKHISPQLLECGHLVDVKNSQYLAYPGAVQATSQ